MEYIVYCRKSTETEDRQVLSLDSQLEEMKKIANKENLKVRKVYKESMSAHSEGRPIYREMINEIKHNPGVGLLVWDIDRIARNANDGGEIITLMDNNCITEIRTYQKIYKNEPMDKFLLFFAFGMSKKTSDDLSVIVKRGNRAKLEKGGWPNRAPLGYKNNKAKNTIAVDKKLSGYVIRMFELCASGKYNFQEISNILYEEGLRTRSGKKVFKSTIQRTLNKPFYFGVMEREDKVYKGNHKPLITKELFDKAQLAIGQRNRPKRQTLFFPYRGLINCSCGCVYTASLKRGHDYYYCTNGKGVCEAHASYLRSENIDELLADELGKIRFDEEFIEISYEAYREKHLSEMDYQNTAKGNLEKELSNVQDKKAKLLDAYLSSLIDQSLYESKLKELENNTTTLESQLSNIGVGNIYGENTLEQIKNIFLTASRAKKNFLERDPHQKRELLESLLWNIEIENKKIAHSRFKEPYNILADVPKNCDFSTMLGDRDSNPD